MELLQGADFWIGLIKIVWINIILSGDNAVVIAMAARALPPAQQQKAVLLGSGAAVVAARQWRSGEGTRGARLRYSSVVVVALLFAWSLSQWNLLGWHL